MTEVVLHGLAANLFKSHYGFYNIYKATDAIRAIDANNPGFIKYMTESSQKNMHYELIVNGESLKKQHELIENKEIKRIDIVPVICGNAEIIIPALVQFAISVVMAGIQYLLTPIPEEEPKGAVARIAPASFMFANRENITEQYTAVPIGYGALRIGSKVIQSIVEPIDLSQTSSKFSKSNFSSSVASSSSTVGGGY